MSATDTPLTGRIWRAGLRVGFHLLYNQMAWSYDLVSSVVSAGKWRDWQRAALAHVAGTYVLELGHGPGHSLVDLHARGHSVIGIDVSRAMSRLAQRRTRSLARPVHLLRAQAQAIPLTQASIDTILALFPTPYIVDPVTLAEVHRVLKPGGRLVILPEARLAPTGIGNRFLETLYKLTGQRPSARVSEGEWTGADLDDRAGFWLNALSATPEWSTAEIRVHYTLVDDSRVTIIIAQR